MSARDLVKSMMQGKSQSAMIKAMENANEVAARANDVGPKQKTKKTK